MIKGNQNITLRVQDERASIRNTELRLGFSESDTELRFGTESETERRVSFDLGTESELRFGAQ
jgi:hypothetical protein